MSILEDCSSFVQSDFGGTKPILDPIDLSMGDAIQALNCRFTRAQVSTRQGFGWLGTNFGSATVGDGVLMNTPYFFSTNASGTSKSYLVKSRYVQATAVTTIRITKTAPSVAAEVVILTLILGASGATGDISYNPWVVWATAGGRLYATISQYIPSTGGYFRNMYVWDGDESHQMIECFQRPMLTTEVTEALTQPAAGVITAGTHYVGVIFKTKAGYWIRPGPATAALALSPQSIVSTGTNNIRVTLTPATTWPTWISSVQVIMTTVTNSFQYYLVPGSITAVTSGSATVYTIDISIADIQLTAIGSQGAGTFADDYFGLYSMDNGGVQTFKAKAVLTWGQRTVWIGDYGGVDSIFPSDPLNAEAFSPDQHILQLPGGKPVGAAFVLRSVLYVISSDGGMYAWVDNGGKPVSFSPASTVDDKVVCTGFYCVTVAASGGYALIASTSGLYAFSGGLLPALPISYNQTTYYENLTTPGTSAYLQTFSKKFEWAQVLDLPQERLIFLTVFDSGPSAVGLGLFVWDYSDGLSFDRVKFCKWSGSQSMGIGPCCCIANPGNTDFTLVMIGCYNVPRPTLYALTLPRTNYLPRFVSTTPIFSDEIANIGLASVTATGIDFQYETMPLPPDDSGVMFNHLGIRFRATAIPGFSAASVSYGNDTASLTISVKSLDNIRTITVPASPFTLTYNAGGPGLLFLAYYDATEERVSYLFTNGAAVGAGIAISKLTHFYNLLATER